MLRPNGACHRAVQPRSLFEAPSVRISQYFRLADSLQFNLNPEGLKRHGSSVPGPLESRRRLGKRRLGYMASPTLPTTSMLGDFWSWFRTVDRTQWQWQPPNPRPSLPDAASEFPTLCFGPKSSATVPVEPLAPSALLSDSEYVSEAIVVNLARPASSSRKADYVETTATRLQTAQIWNSFVTDTTFTLSHVQNFQSKLRETSPQDCSEQCFRFNKSIRQSLTLGLVHEPVLRHTLTVITGSIGAAFSDTMLAESEKLLFYRAVWEGISNCKVLGAHDYRLSTLNDFLLLISKLSMVSGVRTLLQNVLEQVSDSQLQGLEPGILRLVSAWSRSWLVIGRASGTEVGLRSSRVALLQAAHHTRQVHQNILSAKPREYTALSIENARRCLEQAQSDICSEIDMATQFEETVALVRLSIAGLVHCLRRVPASSLSRIVSAVSTEIVATCQHTWISQDSPRAWWLSFVAQLPQLDQIILITAWRAMREDGQRISDKIGSSLLLSYMIAHGFVREPALVRSCWETASDRQCEQDFGHLLYALNKYEGFWYGVDYLLEFLDQLDQQSSIYNLFLTMNSLGIRPQPQLVIQVLELLATKNARLALTFHDLYAQDPYLGKFIYLSRVPNLVFAMINDPGIDPMEIWERLQIPFYAHLMRHQLVKYSKKPLPPAMLELIVQIATAFSRSKARSTDVAYANTRQCLHHIVNHQTLLSGELSKRLSKALTYAGITRNVLERRWVGRLKVSYILNKIERYEGHTVRILFDEAMWHWRKYLVRQKINRGRRSRKKRRDSRWLEARQERDIGPCGDAGSRLGSAVSSRSVNEEKVEGRNTTAGF